MPAPTSCLHRYILHPISNGRLVWDYALRFLVLATLVVVPLRLAFVHTTEQLQRSWGLSIILYADVALDALCVLDVLSNFSFGFVTVNPETARREVVSDGRRIAIRYLRKTCALEVLSIGIPFEAAPQRSFETQLLSLFKLLRAQRWLRVRARERHRAHEVGRMPRHVVVEKLSNIFKLLIFFLAWAHLTCCICTRSFVPSDPKHSKHRAESFLAPAPDVSCALTCDGALCASSGRLLHWQGSRRANRAC